MHENEQCLAQIVNAGAIGCVVKCSAGTELVTAVRAAARGESYFSPTMATMMLEGYRSRLAAEGRDECDLLTEREREILQMEAEGKTNQEIADSLVVSIKTVQTHRARMMEKLEAHDRTELVKHAIRLGMITPH